VLVGDGAQVLEEAGCGVFQSMGLIDYHHLAEDRGEGRERRVKKRGEVRRRRKRGEVRRRRNGK
jgi:hypothetical protein